jgi:lipid II:glycine glycyltransferase (peptidoglycan interpeptide bridge formation enzyme)
MQRNRAAAFYYFSREYICALKNTLGEHGSLLVSLHKGEVAAGLFLIEYGRIVNVHLAASNEQFASMSPNKQLFHEAQVLAQRRGNKFLHMGGGRASRDDDPLFQFKSRFSPTHFVFYTGRWILNQQSYEFLRNEHRRNAVLLEDSYMAEDYFPAYRAPILEKNGYTKTPVSTGSEQ